MRVVSSFVDTAPRLVQGSADLSGGSSGSVASRTDVVSLACSHEYPFRFLSKVEFFWLIGAQRAPGANGRLDVRCVAGVRGLFPQDDRIGVSRILRAAKVWCKWLIVSRVRMVLIAARSDKTPGCVFGKSSLHRTFVSIW